MSGHVVPARRRRERRDASVRLALFDKATAQQRQRQRQRQRPVPAARERGWTREELYQRGDAPR